VQTAARADCAGAGAGRIISVMIRVSRSGPLVVFPHVSAPLPMYVFRSVGKTMLSVALARAAAEAGHKVLFTTCEDLVRRQRRAIAEHRAASGLRFFTTPKLLVIDEVGYRILDEEARSLLFEVINARYLKGSIIATSHVGIASWAERLGDPMLAAAALDRLPHRGVIVGIDGPSYRMRAHQQRADTIRKATATRTRGRP